MNNLTTHFLVLALTLVIISCNKEGCTDLTADNYDKKAVKDNKTCTYNTKQSQPDSPLEIEDYCNYTIDGTPINSSSFFNFYTSFTKKYRYISYQGTSGTKPFFAIDIEENILRGTYLNQGQYAGNVKHQFRYSTNSNYYFGNGTTGFITIEHHDTVNNIIVGTFEGTLYSPVDLSSVTFSNGSFGFNY